VTCDQFHGLVPRPGGTLPVNAPAIGIQQTQFSESAWDAGTSRVVFGVTTLVLERLDGGTLFAPHLRARQRGGLGAAHR